MFTNHLNSLKSLFDKIKCSDEKGFIDLDKGVEEVIDRIHKVKTNGKKMMWIGNGGSAAIVEHSTLDYFRTGNIKTQAFNNGPMITCLGNDFGYHSVFEKPIALFAEEDDILVAISSSGKSQNILNAVETAKRKNCYIITLSGFSLDNPLRRMGNINFYVPVEKYGLVELTHAVLCHSFLDLYMARENGGQ